MMFLNTDGRQNGRSFNLDFKFTDEQIKLLQKLLLLLKKLKNQLRKSFSYYFHKKNVIYKSVDNFK